MARRLQAAKLRGNAYAEHIDFRAARGAEESIIRGLTRESKWVKNYANVFVVGTVGVGNGFEASALARKACRHGYIACLARAAALFRNLENSRAPMEVPVTAGTANLDLRAGDRRPSDGTDQGVPNGGISGRFVRAGMRQAR